MTSTTITPASDDEVVLFVTSEPAPTGFTPHSKIGDQVRGRVGELRENYREVVSQILAMVQDSDNVENPTSFRLAEISVELGFDAKGKLGFIAGVEVGANATVSVKFERPAASS